MTAIDKAALRKLAEEATKGEWTRSRDINDQQVIYAGDEWIALLPHQCVTSIEEQRERDAEFICAARNAVHDILDQFDRAEAECERLRGAVGELALSHRTRSDSLYDSYAKLEVERDRLLVSLKKANDNHEEYERRWYLTGDQLSACRAALGEMTTARDEACDLADERTFVDDHAGALEHAGRIAALRSVGQAK